MLSSFSVMAGYFAKGSYVPRTGTSGWAEEDLVDTSIVFEEEITSTRRVRRRGGELSPPHSPPPVRSQRHVASTTSATTAQSLPTLERRVDRLRSQLIGIHDQMTDMEMETRRMVTRVGRITAQRDSDETTIPTLEVNASLTRTQLQTLEERVNEFEQRTLAAEARAVAAELRTTAARPEWQSSDRGWEPLPVEQSR